MTTPKVTVTPLIRKDIPWTRWGWLVESVAHRCGVTVDGLLSRARTSELADARRELMASLWGSGCSYAQIGRLLGRDHTTVVYAVRKALR
jgi:chromosomal replication initiation ATPase DnaA